MYSVSCRVSRSFVAYVRISSDLLCKLTLLLILLFLLLLFIVPTVHDGE